jgi:hypothetical protein
MESGAFMWAMSKAAERNTLVIYLSKLRIA